MLLGGKSNGPLTKNMVEPKNQNRMENMHVPNFFIVGFPKCGTTTLYENLRQHPDVFMPWDDENFWITKEPNFFDKDLQIDHQFSVKDEQAYLSLFKDAKDKKCIGESSTFYIYSQEAPKRILEMNRDAKVIIMLRNPIDMVVSWHFDCYRWGHEDILYFEQALDAEEDRRKGLRIPHRCYYPELLQYKSMGKYSQHIARYLDLFGPDQVKIVLLDDLKNAPNEVFKEVTQFLNIDSNFVPDRANHNPSIKLSKLHRFTLSFWERYGKLQQRLTWIPGSLWRVVGKICHKLFLSVGTVEKQTVNEQLKAKLMTYYRDDIQKVEQLIKCDLSAWYQ